VLVAVVITELGRARPGPAEAPGGTASLQVRRVRDYVPGSLARSATACAAVTIVAIAVILGIARFGPWDGYDSSGLAGPFSQLGMFPDVGMAGLLLSTWITVIAAVLLAGIALWLVARSPLATGDPDLVRRDDRWRHEVATTVVAAVGWVAAVPLAVVAFLLAAVMVGWGPSGLLPFIPALAGGAAVLSALRFAGRLLDEPRRESRDSPQWTRVGV
jgi:hypothetical protein